MGDKLASGELLQEIKKPGELFEVSIFFTILFDKGDEIHCGERKRRN